MEDYKLVIVVRDDLALSPGKLAAQVAHAAVLCTLKCRGTNPKWMKSWLAQGGKKVVLQADFETLKELEKKATANKLVAILIKDAGRTEILPGTATCIGIGPAPEHLIDKLTGALPLL